jgi:nucleoside-diphosphate-sugar epimerase
MNSKLNSDLHVVFGTGPIGRAVIGELARRGQTVRAVNRRGQADVPPGVEVLKGDATDPASVRQLSAGAAVVYNCLNAPDYHKWPQQFPPLQAGMLAGVGASGAKLVVMDNLYMYGPTGGRPLTEDLPLNGHGGRGGTRSQMARDLFAAHQAGKVRVVVGRASDFFGPGALDSSAGARLFYPALAGKTIQWMGDPDVPHTFTYVPDIGRALVTLGEADDAYGQAWHIPSPPTVTPREFITRAAAEAGQPPKISALKKGMARAALLPLLGLFVPPLRGYGEMLYEFDEPFIVDSSRFIRRFGDLSTPLDEAIRATVAWFKANPPA